MSIVAVKRALISVSDKSGLIPFANQLVAQGVEIISTGGTAKALEASGVPHRQVEEVTNLPEMLGGRVKTLHPRIHGGILGRRDTQADEAKEHGIEWIDLVVVNFYPFSQAVANQANWDEAVEKIDIGGPTMVRAAAKNFSWVGVVTDPADYAMVVSSLKSDQGLGIDLRQGLAQKAFALTSQYDAMIESYFINKRAGNSALPAACHMTLQKKADLRYGENPHQQAAAYALQSGVQGVLSAKQHQGKELSYNNMLDADAAWNCLLNFEQPACVIVKHANPCGVATSHNIEMAFSQAFAADSLSAFGGIVALNRPCSAQLAKQLSDVFLEIVIAPAFDEAALEVLKAKPNLRLLSMSELAVAEWEMRYITGGILMQQVDQSRVMTTDLQCVTKQQPTEAEMQDLRFAWQVVKYIKSNAILLAKNQQTVGMGAGQVSRVDAVDLAIKKAGDQVNGSVLASDAFFPFRDSIDRLAGIGVRAIIQPGGSKRDQDVIDACDEHGIAMVFTGIRCFRH